MQSTTTEPSTSVLGLNETTTSLKSPETNVKVERIQSKTTNSDVQKEKIKISAKFDEKQFKQEQKAQLNCGLYFILQILSLITLILMTIWFIENFNGFSLKFSDSNKLFNIHPLLMVFGLIFVFANSLLLLTSSKSLRFARTLLAFIAIAAISAGLVITVYWHMNNEYEHFESLHSWFGIITMVFLFTFFLYSYRVYSMASAKSMDDLERLYAIKNLRLLGIGTLITAGITCTLGISQNLIIRSLHKPSSILSKSINNNQTDEQSTVDGNYERVIHANLIGNSIGLFLLCYIVSMIYLMNKMRFEPWSLRKREHIAQQLRKTVEQAMTKLDKDEQATTTDDDSNKTSSKTN